jgi:acetyl-CoA C-acetyltransferase
MKAKNVYLVDYNRTAFSRASPKDHLQDVLSAQTGPELTVRTINNMFDKRIPTNGGTLKRENLSELLTGCSQQQSDNANNGGRIPLFMAKIPFEVPAVTFDKKSGSGLTAMKVGFGNIAMSYSDVVMVTAYDHGTRLPVQTHGGKVYVYENHPTPIVTDSSSKWYSDDIYDWNTMYSDLQGSQKLAEEEKFSKEDMDKFATRSHNLAEKAQASGWFKDVILPVKGHEAGNAEVEIQVSEDVCIRKGATLEATAGLPAVTTPGWNGGFNKSALSKEDYVAKFGTENGVITAGNASPENTGASTILIASEDAMKEYNLKPMVKIASLGWAGDDPTTQRGAVPAAQMALKHAGLKADDINYWEIDESFSVVVLNAIEKLGISDWESKVNVCGGSIAIGLPMAASGLRLMGNCARILKEKKARYGLVTMSCGGGQGIAVVLENEEA